MATWPECRFLAEGVEKVPRVRIFETMIQNSGRCCINVASNAAYRNDSCAKSVGSDLFNTLSQNQMFSEVAGCAYRFHPRIYETRLPQLHYLAFFESVTLTINIS